MPIAYYHIRRIGKRYREAYQYRATGTALGKPPYRTASIKPVLYHVENRITCYPV